MPQPPTGPPGPGSGEPSDLALAEALIEGRPEAFDRFVRRFGPLILGFGRRMCGRRDDAEEVLQETLLKAYLSLRDLRSPAALKAWVYRVAANACYRMRRDGAHEPAGDLSLEDVLPRPGEDGSPPQVADWSDLPLDRLLQGELRDRLDAAILALPRDYRIVLVLRDQEGFSTRETADLLAITESLAKVRLHRARLAVRRSLDGYLRGAA
jgi:RNA polymerase sigma-70 factor, ECF subfamily